MKNIKDYAVTAIASISVAILWVILVIVFGLFCRIVANLFSIGWNFI